VGGEFARVGGQLQPTELIDHEGLEPVAEEGDVLEPAPVHRQVSNVDQEPGGQQEHDDDQRSDEIGYGEAGREARHEQA